MSKKRTTIHWDDPRPRATFLVELRRSNAAGKHGSKSKDRSGQRRKYLKQENIDNG